MYDLVVIGNPAYYENKSMEMASGAVYTAVTAAKLGVENVALVGITSNELRDTVKQVLNRHDIEFFLPDSAETSRFQVSLDLEGTNYANLVGTKREIGIRDVPDEFLRANMIILSPVLREIHAEFIEWLHDSSDSTILLDPRFRRISDDNRVRLMGNHRVAEEILGFIDVVKLNRLESKILTGEKDPLLAVEILVESGSDLGIVTLSDEGSIVFDGKDFYRIPAFRVDTANGIGAGDSYLSGFASKMLEERPIAECGAFASAVASIVVESYAGIDFRLDSNEVQRRTSLLLEETTVR
ncbi:MAG: carbohydrate kinase family protein [Candidatus Thorarchaeota archaeon]|jgi:sugar/nucleoside kinase (ribokinase family)